MTRKTPSAPATQSAPAPLPTLYPITKWPHPWPPVGGLRWLAFNAKTNGFADAFVRVGSRVLVNEAEFFRCVAANNRPKPRRAIRRPLSAPRPVEILDDEAA